tara:strand:+ start:125 stop:871 length:747 start_codon:yes stop_codon:yes gene_type:complete
MERPSKTELVFVDIERLYTEINQYRRRPRLFRSAFEMYVYKSQQLTEAMRSEYKLMTGAKWNASVFSGWNEFTQALKKIRNAATHGCPIVLNESILGVYPAVELLNDEEPLIDRFRNNGYRVIYTHSFIAAPFSETLSIQSYSIPLKHRLFENPEDSRNYAAPVKEYIFYNLKWDLLELGVMKGTAHHGQVDAIKLVLRSFPALKKYMIFYREELAKNLTDGFKPDYFIRPASGLGWVVNPRYLTGKV